MTWRQAIERVRSRFARSSRARMQTCARRIAKSTVFRGRLEELEGRLVPTVSFDPTTHTLAVVGDKSRPRDDVIDVAITRRDFVAVRVNGQMVRSIRHFGKVPAASVIAISVRGLAGNDTLSVTGRFPQADGKITLDGGAGNDSIIGSVVSDVLLGGDGTDTIRGGEGNDMLNGGADPDLVLGEGGNDTLMNDPRLPGNVVTTGDTLLGGDGDDTIRGGSDVDDLLYGEDGDDTLQSRESGPFYPGVDTLTGGSGSDFFQISFWPVQITDLEEGDRTERI